MDELIDIAGAGVSLAVREICCRIATDSASFSRAASNLERSAQLKLSDEKLRQVVEAEGRAVIAWQEQEQLELDFTAAGCVTSATPDNACKSRVYVGIDGFLLPMVTDAEKSRRFEKARSRRKTLKRTRGVRRRRLQRRRGADQRYKEFKLVTMYDQDQRRKYLRVTRQGADRAGRMIREMAEDVRLGQADEVVAVTDGAEWIARLVESSLPADKTTAVLDFYHAAEHVHQTRRALFGEESESGRQWAEGLIGGLLTESFETTWDRLLAERSRVRSRPKRASVDGLMQYLLKRREKVDYRRFRAMGFKIGSGPTESACKSEARRLKGAGMRWNACNAEAMAALEALNQSNQWSAYWQRQLKPAA